MRFSLGSKIATVIMAVFLVEGFVAVSYLESLTEKTLKKVINEEFMQTMLLIENQFVFIEQSNIYIANSLIEHHASLEDIDRNQYSKNLEIDNVTILDKNGNMIKQWGMLHIDGDNLEAFHIIHESLKTKEPISKIERIGDLFVFFSAVPVLREDIVEGIVVIGLQISNKVLQEMNRGSNIQLAVVGDRVIGATSFFTKGGEALSEMPVSYTEYLLLLKKKIDLLTAVINEKEYFIKAK